MEDLIYQVIKYLPLKDIYCLDKSTKISKPYLLQYISNRSINNIDIKLKNIFKDKYDIFNKLLIESGSIISGSFVLQNLLNEYWDESDIDIYVPYNNKLLDKNFKPTSQLDKFLLENYKLENSLCSNSYYILIEKVETIKNYMVGGKKIQIILVKNIQQNEFKDYINNNFDFDICKNFYGIRKDGNKFIDIYNFDQIFEKKTEFKYSTNLPKTRITSSIVRYNKYIKRGIIFDKIDTTKTFEDFIQKDKHRYRIIYIKWSKYIYMGKDHVIDCGIDNCICKFCNVLHTHDYGTIYILKKNLKPIDS